LNAGEPLDESPASALCGASDEVQHEQDEPDDEDKVDHGGGDVERQKTQQPENNKNCGNHSKHMDLLGMR
jgi:hypothetical protein